VTQQFNTTTSMGRLTLNVLLSLGIFPSAPGETVRNALKWAMLFATDLTQVLRILSAMAHRQVESSSGTELLKTRVAKTWLSPSQ
jgi:hypothetical protein